MATEILSRHETSFVNTAAEACALADTVDMPTFGILVNTYHMGIEEKSIGGAIVTARRHPFYLHACENDRGTPGLATSLGRKWQWR